MRKPELAAASEVITVITDLIGKTLSEDDTVSLIGFGTFSRRSRAERKGKNPQTGAELIIPASNTAAFKPGKGLKEKVQ